MLSHTLSRSPHYKWWVFAAVGLGSFTGVMTFGTVNVALPTIAGYFETDLPTVQWTSASAPAPQRQVWMGKQKAERSQPHLVC